jgi:asparaginyl-tRNA synthetase
MVPETSPAILRHRVAHLLVSTPSTSPVCVKGWVRTRRESKAGVAFVEVNDGSTFENLQVVVPTTWAGYSEVIPALYPGTSIEVTGLLVASQGGKQKVEVQAETVKILGGCDPLAYPIGKQKMTYEYLREHTHLRGRTNTFAALMRLRNTLSAGVHQFFQSRGFTWLHTPILTGNDCEGAGSTFRVTTLDMDALAKSGKPLDPTQDFFGKPVNLTVSGQLEGEAYACAIGDIYTFGPTFRAENSHTSRHLAEFWMVEPEMAFADLDDDMELAEAFLKFLIREALNKCPKELEFFEQRVAPGLNQALEDVANRPFVRMSYTEAVSKLKSSGQKFQYPVEWGHDLQSEHERWLTEKLAAAPVILTDYPKDIKAFYMRLNDDGKTVRAMDVLVPQIGEIIGGAQREERLDVLQRRIQETGMHAESLEWYMDLRRFGTVPHAGFGLGFERLVQFVSGMNNIRDVIPFPRHAGRIGV